MNYPGAKGLLKSLRFKLHCDPEIECAEYQCKGKQPQHLLPSQIVFVNFQAILLQPDFRLRTEDEVKSASIGNKIAMQSAVDESSSS